MDKLVSVNPDFKGPIPVDEAIKKLRSAWEKADIDNGSGGAVINIFGDR